MAFRPRAIALLASSAVVVTSAVAVLSRPMAAGAGTPVPPTLTLTAPRTNADGGPADLAYVDSYVLTRAADGSVLYYDRIADQIRRVDATSRDITVVAGSGTTLTTGALDTTHPAIAAALPPIDGLWTDTVGDLFAWTCVGTNCNIGHDLYRLDHGDGTWHLAVSDPNLGGFRWGGFAVAPDGDVLVTDTSDFVVRRISAGADPGSLGTIVAGTFGTPGSSGNGGPATMATIVPMGPITVTVAGEVYFADGSETLRDVDGSGTISQVGIAPSAPDPSTRWSVDGLATGADGATVYAEVETPTQAEIRVLPAGGGSATTVAGPLPACNTGTQGCIQSNIAEVQEDGSTVVVAATGSIQSWPADGSDPLRYHRYAGVLNDALGVRSPDGTRLDEAYLGITGIAVAPSGVLALSAPDGIHTLTGLAPDSTISTLAPGIVTSSMQYADDGTLFALVEDPTPHVVAISSTGTVSTVLGGGNKTLAAGVDPLDVQLPSGSAFAVDAQTGGIVFDTGASSTIWALASGSVAVSQLGSSLPFVGTAGALAVAPDHSVLVGAYADDGLTRLNSDGSTTSVCTLACPETQLQQLPDGLITGLDVGNSRAALGPDGTVETLPGWSAVPSSVTPDDRVIVVAAAGSAGGLLAESSPLAAPQPVDAPAVTAAPASAAISVHVTAVAGQEVTVYAAPEGPDGSWTASPTQYEDTVSNGSALTFTLRHLFTTWPAAAGSVTPATDRVEVIASEAGDGTHDAVANAPQVFHVRPQLDNVAPAAPTITVGAGSFVAITVNGPADPDADRVVVCQTIGTAPASDPHTCDDPGEAPAYDGPVTFYETIDPTVATTFTAFTVDDAGNVSVPVSVTHTAPVLVSGAAVHDVYVIARPGVERVVWSGGWADYVRYAIGTTAPATPRDGSHGGQLDGGGLYPNDTGYFSDIPVASGAKVSVSIFTWTGDTLAGYRRTSLVLTGGTSSDGATVSATARVPAGKRPSVQVRLTRHAPIDGTSAVAGTPVSLYRRTAGASTWTLITTGTSSRAGIVNFTVPVPAAATQYYAKSVGTAETLTSPTVTTTVVQTLTIGPSAHVKAKHRITMSGTVAPHRITTVHLQRYVGKHWVTVGSVRTSSKGTYRLSYMPSAKGKETVRTYVPATKTLLGGYSAHRSLTVS